MYVQQLLEKGFDVCSFDFAGSGNSEGEYVSLGCNEKDDVLILVRYIQKKYSVNRFCFWGRSMGAVTAIKFNKLLVEKKK